MMVRERSIDGRVVRALENPSFSSQPTVPADEQSGILVFPVCSDLCICRSKMEIRWRSRPRHMATIFSSSVISIFSTVISVSTNFVVKGKANCSSITQKKPEICSDSL